MSPAGKTSFKEIERLAPDLKKCIKCGFCASWCPVYYEERNESTLSRGKNALIRELVDGNLTFSDTLVEKLEKCTLCMTCTENCPVKTDIPSLIIAARAEKTARKGIGFPYNIIFRWLLPRRRLFGQSVRLVSRMQKVLFPEAEGTVRHLPLFLSALGKGRHIPRIAPKFMRQLAPVVNSPPPGTKKIMTVGFFTGCMIEYVFPQIGRNIVKILNEKGVEVVMPREQGCCGAPVYLGSGDLATGRKMADANVRAFSDFDLIVTSCATCGSALKDYVRYLADTPERTEAYRRLGAKIKDISEFLVDAPGLPLSGYKVRPEFRGKKVTWHDPCHLNRHMGVREQPRKLLRSLAGIRYVEMPEAQRCCGMAGTFSLKFYDLSQHIADRKFSNIEASGAEIVATGCPGCMIQLIDASLRRHKEIRVVHLLELFE
jgi:glycolate oxidase iron-sulfur subunit